MKTVTTDQGGGPAEQTHAGAGSQSVRFLLGLLILLSAGPAVRADHWICFSTAKARAVALGGAYTSAEDDLFSALWNPAGFGRPGYLTHPHARAYVSPTTTLMALRGFASRDGSWNEDDGLTEPEAIYSTLWALKGFSIGWRTWMLGFINVDEALQPSAGSILSSRNGITAHTYTLALSFRLAPQVALGASGARVVRNGPSTGSGWRGSFGVLLRPASWINVGLTYIVKPVPDEGLAGELERIDNGTINGGISIYPWRGGALFVDLRNLDDADGRFGFAEPHVGFEQNVHRLIALRGGWYRTTENVTNVYSAGIGIRAFWQDADMNRPGRRIDMLAYTFVWQHNVEWDKRWHMVSLTVPVEW